MFAYLLDASILTDIFEPSIVSLSEKILCNIRSLMWSAKLCENSKNPSVFPNCTFRIASSWESVATYVSWFMNNCLISDIKISEHDNKLTMEPLCTQSNSLSSNSLRKSQIPVFSRQLLERDVFTVHNAVLVLPFPFEMSPILVPFGVGPTIVSNDTIKIIGIITCANKNLLRQWRHHLVAIFQNFRIWVEHMYLKSRRRLCQVFTMTPKIAR